MHLTFSICNCILMVGAMNLLNVEGLNLTGFGKK